MSESDTTRPKVTVSALTATSCEVLIETEAGIARLVCSNDGITINAEGARIEVHP